MKCICVLFSVFVMAGPGYGQIPEGQHLPASEKMISSDLLSDSDKIRLKVLFDSSEQVRHYSATKAIDLLQRALVICRELRFAPGVAHALNGLAGCYTDQGRFEDAAIALREAWPYCFLANEKTDLLTINWYNNMSSVFLKRGNTDQAYKYLDVAVNKVLLKKPVDSSLLLMLYTNIGGVWNAQGDPDRALYYLRKGQAIGEVMKKKGDAYKLAAIYNLIGLSYDRHRQYDSARMYYRQAEALSRETGNVKAERLTHINLGNMYIAEGKYDSAIHYLEKGLDRQEASNTNVPTYFYLAKVYLEKEDLPQAQVYATKALEAIRSAEAKFQYSIVYRIMSVIYAKSGDYRNAYSFLEKHMEMKDSLISREKERAVSELDIKYRSAEKDLELSGQRLLLVEKEHKIREKSILVWSVISVAGGLVLLIFGWYRYRQKLQTERIGNLEKDQEIRRLHAIMEGEEQERSRIAHELHDGIVSQLTAVKLNFSSLLQQEHPDKSLLAQGFRYLDEAMQDLRKTAHNLMPETVLQKGLLASLNDFCLKMDNENATRIHYLTSGELPAMDPQMALSIYRMVQELVQNALKHARARNLLVQLNCQEDLLDLTVEDDGAGFPKGISVEEGAGLQHIRQRVTAMKGHIEFINSDTGVTVYAEIPLPRYSA